MANTQDTDENSAIDTPTPNVEPPIVEASSYSEPED
jgi:hypothetical protein